MSRMDIMQRMQLRDWLEEEDISLGEFAKQIGVSNASVVSRYALGHRMPRKKILQRITDVTKGQVTANDFWHAQ